MTDQNRLTNASPLARDWLSEILKRWCIPGLSVSTISRKEGEDTWDTKNISVGIRDAEGSPYGSESIFLIASCSKLFVAYAIGILIADKTILPNGKELKWETKLMEIFSNFVLQDDYATEKADIIDLLSMRIGLPGHDRILESQSTSDLVHQLRYLTMSAEFRQVRQYSNISFNIGAEIVTVLSGKPYTQFVQERVLDPLQMKDSTFDPTDAQAAGRRVHCFVQSDVDERKAAEAWNDRNDIANIPEECASKAACYEWAGSQPWELNAGCGGLWSTGPDMIQWLKEISSPSLIPKEIREQIFSPHSIPFTNPPYPETGHFTYGLGTYAHTHRGYKAYYHSGGCPGQYSYQLVLPDIGKGVFVHSNEDVHSWWITKAVAYTLMDEMLGQPWLEKDWMKVIGNARWSQSRIEDQKPYSLPSVLPLDIAGDYCHPAYPTFSVQPLEKDDNIRAFFPIIQARWSSELHLDEGRPLFIGRIKTIYVEEVIFVHEGGSIFTWIATKLYKSSGSKDPESRVVPFVDGVGKCRFTSEGLGMSGDWWVSGGKRRWEIKDGNSDDDVEVWYDKSRS